jgi:hypothetical protein
MTNNFRQWISKKETIEENKENSPLLWNNSLEKEQENIDKVKKQWQKKQHQEFKRIRHQEFEKRNIKVIISSLVTITLIAVAFPYVANWWEMGHNSIMESSSEETAEDGSEKGGFLNKLNDLKQEQKGEASSEELGGKKTKTGKKPLWQNN